MSNMIKILTTALYGLMQVTFVGIASADVIWLSETPPSKRASTVVNEAMQEQHAQHEHSQHVHEGLVASSATASTAGMTANGVKKHQHSGGAEVDADGEVVADTTHNGNKQVWLRSGENPRSAKYLNGVQGTLTLLRQDGSMPGVALSEGEGLTTAKLDLPDLGFYNAYWVQKMVHGGMLHVEVAKAELLHGTCCAKDVDDEAVAKPIINTAIPLELVREHYPNEGLFTRIVSGDTVNFIVLNFGKPVAGAVVAMISHRGWRNTQTSDADGRVSFTLVRDYYPNWLEFKKRFKQSYLVTADLNVPVPVTIDGVSYRSAHYNTTLAGSYFPSPHDYRSYAWGLGIGLLVIVFGGLAVYLYRRRRLKPYKEVRIDDKA